MRGGTLAIACVMVDHRYEYNAANATPTPPRTMVDWWFVGCGPWDVGRGTWAVPGTRTPYESGGGVVLVRRLSTRAVLWLRNGYV
jgi:hypothetical protein